MRLFSDGDFQANHFSPAYEIHFDGFADAFAVERWLEASRAPQVVAGDADQDVADDDAGFCGWAIGLNEYYEKAAVGAEFAGCFFREGNGLHADAEISAGDSAFADELVDDAIEGRRGNGYGRSAGDRRSQIPTALPSAVTTGPPEKPGNGVRSRRSQRSMRAPLHVRHWPPMALMIP